MSKTTTIVTCLFISLLCIWPLSSRAQEGAESMQTYQELLALAESNGELTLIQEIKDYMMNPNIPASDKRGFMGQLIDYIKMYQAALDEGFEQERQEFEAQKGISVFARGYIKSNKKTINKLNKISDKRYDDEILQCKEYEVPYMCIDITYEYNSEVGGYTINPEFTIVGITLPSDQLAQIEEVEEAYRTAQETLKTAQEIFSKSNECRLEILGIIDIDVPYSCEEIDDIGNTIKEGLEATQLPIMGAYHLFKGIENCAQQDDVLQGFKVPSCIWENTQINALHYYSPSDLPFICGITDGMLELVELGYGILKLVSAWSPPVYIICEYFPGLLDITPYLLECAYNNIILPSIEAVFDEDFGKEVDWSDVSKAYCLEMQEVRNKTTEMFSFVGRLVSDDELQSKISEEIKKELKEYFEEITSFDNKGRYLQGKLFLEVASFVVGIGEIKAAMKAGGKGVKILIQSIKSPKKALKEIGEAGKKLSDDGKKLLTKISSKVDNFYKSVDDFAETIKDFKKISSTIKGEAFNYYKQKKWAKLEELFKTHKINDGWPPAYGGFNIIDDVPIKKGMKFDRYQRNPFGYDAQGNPILGGTYTSPSKSTPYTFNERALQGVESDYGLLYEIEVMKDLPFHSMDSDVIPWFGKAGGGKQNLWKIPNDPNTGHTKTWNRLAEEGYIKITIKNSPSGKYAGDVGKVIK